MNLGLIISVNDFNNMYMRKYNHCTNRIWNVRVYLRNLLHTGLNDT